MTFWLVVFCVSKDLRKSIEKIENGSFLRKNLYKSTFFAEKKSVDILKNLKFSTLKMSSKKFCYVFATTGDKA